MSSVPRIDDRVPAIVRARACIATRARVAARAHSSASSRAGVRGTLRADAEAGALDRVALELTMPVDVDGEERPRVVLYAYARDSYDGRHKYVLEDSVLCTTLIERIGSQIGIALDAQIFIDLVGAAIPDSRDLVRCLVENLAQANVTTELTGPNLE